MQCVLEGAINIAEKVTGKDIDGDGDVGMRAAKVAGRGEPTESPVNTNRICRPSPTASPPPFTTAV